MLRFGPRMPAMKGMPYIKSLALLLVLLLGLLKVLPYMSGAPGDKPEGRRADIPLKPVSEPTDADKRSGRLSVAPTAAKPQQPAQPKPQAEPKQQPQPKHKSFLSEFESYNLDAVVDQRMPLEKEPLMFLLKKVAGTDADALESYVNPQITYTNFAVAPERCRGHVCRFIGTLLRVQKSLVDVSDAGLDAVYEGQVVDKDYHLYSFYVTDAPLGFKTREDVVVLVGAFYKNIVYETQGGGYKATPLIIGRRLVRYHNPRIGEQGPDMFVVLWRKFEKQPALAGAILGLVAALAFILYRRREMVGAERDRQIAEKMAKLEAQDLELAQDLESDDQKE